MPRKKRPTRNRQEDKTVRSLDHLADFEEFSTSILPVLRQDIKDGMTAEQLRKKYEALVEARTISIAFSAEDPGKALAAAKDVKDRASGKAREVKDIHHHMEDLPEEEIDALLKTKMAELGIKDEDSLH